MNDVTNFQGEIDPEGDDETDQTKGTGSRSFRRDYAVLFLISGSIVFLDQLTKYLVRSNLELGSIWAPWDWLYAYARIVHWQNSGAAFGMFQNFGAAFAILAILVSVAIIYYYPRVPAGEWTLRLAMALQLGGALGNLISRLTVGEVTDWISIWRFPVFNVADASITLGVIVLIYGILQGERKERKAQKVQATTTPPAENASQEGGDQPEPDAGASQSADAPAVWDSRD